MARFSKHRWPADGPVRDLLAYLDKLHREQGQPSMAEVGRAVRLAPATVSAFFTGARLIGRENLARLVTYLGGDPDRAEQLRRGAATAWNEERAGHTAGATARAGPPPPTDPGPDGLPAGDGTTRLDIVIFRAAVNRLNRPELLVGREQAIDTVSGWLDDGGRVLLHGLGGSGKTALAATIADRHIDAGKGPYLWLRTGQADEEVVLDGLARCLGLADGGRASTDLGRLLAITHAITASGVGLCVLDDVWNPSALPTILAALPERVGVLVTSRLKLGLDHQVEVAGLDPAAAGRLLARHARNDAYAAHPDADALCRDMGYHPYAIEIAGHHLRQYGLDPADLRRQIDGAPHDLAMPAGFAAVGRESVKRLLDRTYDGLSNPDAGKAWAAFGAFFSGTLTPELLSRYLGIGLNRTLSALNALVDASLAKRAVGARVYAVHDLTMSYAREVLGAGETDAKAAIDAVRDFVATFAGDHEVIALELDNVLAVADRARDRSVDDVVAIAETLATCGYLDTHGHTLTLLRLLDAAIGFMRGTPGTDRLHHLLSKRGNTCYNQGELAAAIGFYEEALALAPTPQRRAILLGVLGKVLAEHGQHERSKDCFVEAYSIVDSTAGGAVRVRILEQHSVAAFRQADYRLVRELTEQGVALSRELGERALEATFLNNLGTAYFETGVETARGYHEQAMAIARDLNDEHILALTHRCVGADHHAQERFDEARHHLAEALRLYTRLGQTQREDRVRHLMRQFGYLPDAATTAGQP